MSISELLYNLLVDVGDIHVPSPFFFHLVPEIDLGSRLFMIPCCILFRRLFPNERNLLCVHQHYSRAFIPEEVRQHHSLRTNSYHVDYLLLALTF